MEFGQMKNIVVLKNLPSNIVDEAIVVLKPNKKAKQIQHIEKLSKSEKNKKEDSGAYIVKEAQMVISNYLSEIEKAKSDKKDKKILEKYNRLKLITFFLSGIVILNMLINMF